MVDERLLQRMQRALGRETLNRGDLGTIAHDGKRQARIDAPPVNEHGAGAALALIAAFFGSRQVQMLAQQVKERCAGIQHEGMTRPVDGQAHRDRLRGKACVCSVIGHPQLLSSVSYTTFLFLNLGSWSSPGLGDTLATGISLPFELRRTWPRSRQLLPRSALLRRA